jgi:hypothetical protein
MKPTLCLLLLCLLFSCKKENIPIQERLVGKWELRTTYSSWSGTKTYQPGNGNIFEFTKTSFSSYTNGHLDASGSYTITGDTTLRGSIGDRIIYNGMANSVPIFIKISDKKLSFSVEAVDGSGSEYERIK